MSNYNHIIGQELFFDTVACVPSYTAYSEVRLTQQSPLGLPCSREEVILQCTLQGIAAIWTFPGGEITLAPGSNEEITGNFQA